MANLFWFILLSLLPVLELRASIPFGLHQQYHPVWNYLGAVSINILVCPLFWGFLRWGHELFFRWSWYRYLFLHFVEKAREKLSPFVERRGFLGLVLFVATPLPITGAWTGTLGAWILGFRFSRAFTAISVGVAIAGLIVSSVILLGLQMFAIFVKSGSLS